MAAARPATTRSAPKAKPFMPALWSTAPSTTQVVADEDGDGEHRDLLRA